MKRLLTILVAALTIITASATKRALFVAVGNYPAKSGWVKISSRNDVDLLAPVFRRRVTKYSSIFHVMGSRW